MNRRRVAILLFLLVVFTAISAWAMSERSYLALWALIGQDSGTVQLFADLTVAMLLVTSWMIRDARTSGVPAVPYVVLTFATGSFGPLLYLLHRELRAVSPRQARSSRP